MKLETFFTLDGLEARVRSVSSVFMRSYTWFLLRATFLANSSAKACEMANLWVSLKGISADEGPTSGTSSEARCCCSDVDAAVCDGSVDFVWLPVTRATTFIALEALVVKSDRT